MRGGFLAIAATAVALGGYAFGRTRNAEGIGRTQADDVVIHNGFLKAQDYLSLSQGNKNTYVMGLLDGWYMAPTFGGPDNEKLLMKLEKCVEGMKSSQVAAIVEKHVRDHPERWDWDAKDVSYDAMIAACNNR